MQWRYIDRGELPDGDMDVLVRVKFRDGSYDYCAAEYQHKDEPYDKYNVPGRFLCPAGGHVDIFAYSWCPLSEIIANIVE